jgi:hypothetical protein
MKVFLSWSGERSRAVAVALRDWLGDILQDVRPWMSDKDISAGALWFERLNGELAQTSFGVVCLTAENTKAPWLLFEAGAVSKAVETARIAPYCLEFDPSAVQPPLALFQGVRADQSGTDRLLKSINECLEHPLTEERLKRSFERWWPDLEKTLAAIPRSGSAEPVKLGQVYCAYSARYEEAGAQQDAMILEASFPARALLRARVTKSQLERDLSAGKYDIVHLILHTDPHSGDVCFDDAASERIKAEGLRQLIERCGARLICLASCNSGVLGAYLSRSATTIAAYGDTAADAWVSWVRTFYTQLALGASVYAAYDLAQASSDEPMTLNRNTDAVFQVG